MSDFATLQDVIDLFRPLTADEQTKATNLIPIVSASLRMEAEKSIWTWMLWWQQIQTLH